MNPRERFLGALRGQDVDRVPLVLEAFMIPELAQIEDLPDANRREIARRVWPHVAHDVGATTGVSRYLVTPPQCWEHQEGRRGEEIVTTSRCQTPRGTLTAITARNPAVRTTWTVKYPVENLDDVDRIRSLPWQMPKGAATPKLDNLPADFHDRRYTRAGVSSPFVCVGGMMSYEYFLELCATELGLIEELTRICMERILAVLDVVLAALNVEYVWMGGCEWLTPPMGSPKLYDLLVQQYEQPVIERIHAAGALSHVHCHGNVRSTLESAIARGTDFFEPTEPPPKGDVTFAEAKAIVDGRMTLGGNIEARVLECGSIEETDAAVRAAFEGTKRRMVLQTSAGPLSDVSPRAMANYHRLIDLWEELSPIEA